jgi:hypothetical protein
LISAVRAAIEQIDLTQQSEMLAKGIAKAQVNWDTHSRFELVLLFQGVLELNLYEGVGHLHGPMKEAAQNEIRRPGTGLKGTFRNLSRYGTETESVG